MNFSEYKRRLNAEPNCEDPELLAARDSDPRFAEAAADAAAFEAKLEQALAVPHDSEAFLASVRSAIEADSKPSKSRWLAVAACLTLAVGLSVLLFVNNARYDSVNQFVHEHYAHDGPELLARAATMTEPMAATQTNEILASFGVSANPELTDRVRFIKFCPSVHGRGAHMVVSTTEGLATVMYMPGTNVTKPLLFEVDGQRAEVVSLNDGAAAIVGASEEAGQELEAILREALVAHRETERIDT